MMENLFSNSWAGPELCGYGMQRIVQISPLTFEMVA